MSRYILDEEHIHPAIKEKISNNHRDTVEQVRNAVESNSVVVVGMAQNPNCNRARELLKDTHPQFKYLEYGNYFKEWRRRNSLKMWTGWPTFPMVFIKGQLIGGADDLQRLIRQDQFQELVNS